MSESPDPSPAAGPEIRQNQMVGLDGSLSPAGDAAIIDGSVVPLHRLASSQAGEWLLDMLVKSAWTREHPGFRFCGPELSAAQAYVLEKLEQRGYATLSHPAAFAAVAAFAQTGRPPSAITHVAAKLRSGALAGDSRIAILPQHATEQFSLANRASVAAWLRAKRFTLLEPDIMPFDELAASIGGAGLIMLADPRQTGLATLAAPGATLIDVAPAGWRRNTGPQLSELFGLNWTKLDAGPPTYKLLSSLPFGARVPLCYEIPIGDLAKILQTL